MRKFLWIGSYVSGDALEEARGRGYGNPASVQSQKNLLEGLEKAYGTSFDTIGALVLPSYPSIETKSFKEITFKHAEDAKDCLVGYDNRKYFNRISARNNLCRKVKQWANLYAGDSVCVYIYEMRSACLAAAAELKKIIPSATINLIVPDLPAFMDLRMNAVKKALKSVDWCTIKSKLKFVDNYIVYAEPMVDFLGVRDKNWMVMEGSININDIKALNESDIKENRYVVMYSGHVEERFGINNLVDSFQFLPSNFELWITGRGTAARYIEEIGKSDTRIHYHGFLPSREDLLQLQSQADVFVNMRNPDEKASHYCFPSKLFEFMLTGKPVLTCDLKGIPEEYRKYLYFMNSIEPEEIAKSILRVFDDSEKERLQKGKIGRQFIVEKKNNLYQAERIKAFCK